MFVFNDKIKKEECEIGVTKKVLAYSSKLMMTEVCFEKGAIGKIHSHPHLQITYVAKGSLEFTIDEETKVVKQGDSLYMSSNSTHGVKALEDSILVDVFNPMREDFIKKHIRWRN